MTATKESHQHQQLLLFGPDKPTEEGDDVEGYLTAAGSVVGEGERRDPAASRLH